MDNHTELLNKLKEWGATFIGCSRVDEYLDNSLKPLKYAITVGIRLSDSIINEITDGPTYTYFHHYRTVNTLIDQITLKGLLYIQERGYNALAVPASQTVHNVGVEYSGIFSHKIAAVKAGLGWIGKSNLFIHKDYGPRVRLGTLFTDMELPVSVDVEIKEACGNCKKCVESCPAMALTGNAWYLGCERKHILDPRACSEYLNDKFKLIGRGSVCGICIKVCPVGGRQVASSSVHE